jgi:hypothetical protein
MPDYADATNVKPVQSLPNLVNSSDGTASETKTITGPSVRIPISFQIALASIADGDVVTDYPLGAIVGQSGKIVDFTATAGTPASTANKLSTLNLEIGSTNLTGGSLALTTANQNAVGETVRATTITAGNTFSATDTFSIEAASTTAFVEGTTTLIVWVELDNADNNFATIAAQTA